MRLLIPISMSIPFLDSGSSFSFSQILTPDSVELDHVASMDIADHISTKSIALKSFMHPVPRGKLTTHVPNCNLIHYIQINDLSEHAILVHHYKPK